MLRSNIAACHIKLEDWKSAIKAADASLEALDRLERRGKDPATENSSNDDDDRKKESGDSATEECEGEDIISPGAQRSGPSPVAREQEKKGPSDEDISRIRIKALMRRANARLESGGWSALSGAEEGTPCPLFQQQNPLMFHDEPHIMGRCPRRRGFFFFAVVISAGLLTRGKHLLSRLQEALEHVWVASPRPEHGDATTANTTVPHRHCQAEGGGRDDGQAERGMFVVSNVSLH